MFYVYLPIPPKPQPRPRFTRNGHAYEIKAIKDYKRQIAEIVRQKMALEKLEIIAKDTPISVTTDFFFSTPKSWSRKKTIRAVTGRIAHTTKPDCDNLFKAVTDALNGVLWSDDSQIVSASVTKKYATNEGILLTVKTEEANETNSPVDDYLQIAR